MQWYMVGVPRDIDRLGRVVEIFRKTNYLTAQNMVRRQEWARWTRGTAKKREMQTRKRRLLDLRGHRKGWAP